MVSSVGPKPGWREPPSEDGLGMTSDDTMILDESWYLITVDEIKLATTVRSWSSFVKMSWISVRQSARKSFQLIRPGPKPGFGIGKSLPDPLADRRPLRSELHLGSKTWLVVGWLRTNTSGTTVAKTPLSHAGVRDTDIRVQVASVRSLFGVTTLFVHFFPVSGFFCSLERVACLGRMILLSVSGLEFLQSGCSGLRDDTLVFDLCCAIVELSSSCLPLVFYLFSTVSRYAPGALATCLPLSLSRL